MLQIILDMTGVLIEQSLVRHADTIVSSRLEVAMGSSTLKTLNFHFETVGRGRHRSLA